MSTDTKKILIEPDEESFEQDKEKKTVIRVLQFSLGNENYCVDIREVKEVVRIGAVTKVPNTPDFVEGVINLRGEILAVISLKYFFPVSSSDQKTEPMVIVSDVTGSLVGVLVDKVKESSDIEEESIQPPLETVSREIALYTKGQVNLEKGAMAILDLKKILTNSEIEKLRKREV